MYIRYQTVIHLDDLHADFLCAAMDVWNTTSIEAFRCFAIGS
jgi:hypothetical protein